MMIVTLCGPFVLISNCYSNVIRAEGQVNIAMNGMLIGNIANIILDPILICVMGWEIAGAAVATVIGNVLAAGYYLLYFKKGTSLLSIHPKDFSMKEGICKNVLVIGIPAAFGISVVMTGICYIFTGQIVQLVLTDAAAFDYGCRFAQILLTTSFLFGVYYVLTNTLQAMGAATPSLIINLSRQGILFIPILFILEAKLGLEGLLWAQPVVDVLSLLLAIVLYIPIYRKRVRG